MSVNMELAACMGKELVSISYGGDVPTGMYRLHFMDIAVCFEACCKGDDTETTVDVAIDPPTSQHKGFLG